MKKLIFTVVLFLFIGAVNAGDPHHGGIVYDEENMQIANDDNCGAEAVAGASGQHHYKAGNRLQWSSAVVYLDGKCDDTAASFGLALQNGNVFNTINFSSNGDENIIAITASGTF